MKKITLFIISLFYANSLIAQNVFEKGHYVDTEDNIIPGLILNFDWRSNPSEIRFKADSLAQEITLGLTEINGFEIDDYGKFVKFSVDIDRSSENKSNLSDITTPLFNNETILLKSLVEGAISLYSYQDGNLQRFFLKNRNGTIEQLVFRFFARGSRVITDDSFKQQLKSELGCSLGSQNSLEEIDYKRKDLVELVINENECMGELNQVYTYKRGYKKFRLTIKPGLNISNLQLITTAGLFTKREYTSNFDNNFVFNLGLEAEFILPYANGAWSIILQPTYHQFKFEDTFEISSQEREVTVDYKAIEVELGIRYNYSLNKDSKLYFNPLLVYGFDFNSDVKILGLPTSDIVLHPALEMALGFSMKDFTLEVSYSPSRELIANENNETFTFDAENTIIGFTVGYSIF